MSTLEAILPMLIIIQVMFLLDNIILNIYAIPWVEHLNRKEEERIWKQNKQ